MPTFKRIKTNHPGVYYILGTSFSQTGTPEQIYYIRYRKNGKEVEEKAGRQFRDSMTAEKAATIRAECMEGKRLSRNELRDRNKAAKNAQRLIRTDGGTGIAVEGGMKATPMQTALTESEDAFRTFVETVWVTKDGKEEIYGEIKGVAVLDANGGYAGGRTVLRDITTRKRAEQALPVVGVGVTGGGRAAVQPVMEELGIDFEEVIMK